MCSYPWHPVDPGWNQERRRLDRDRRVWPRCLGGPIRGRTGNSVVHIPSGSPMCEIEFVDVGGSTSTRAAFFPSTLLPSALGPLSTTPSTLTSECVNEVPWLASPLMSATRPFPLSALADLPSRLRPPPGSLSFNLLNRFEKDFRKSMSVLDQCRSCQRVWRADELVVMVQDRPASSTQKSILHDIRPMLCPFYCHLVSFITTDPRCTDVHLCSR